MNRLTRHSTEFFQAVSEALFFNNAYVGAALIAILLAFDPVACLCGVLAAVVGYGYSARYSSPRVLKDAGLFTINGLFFGLAMAGLFQTSLQFWILFVLGALALTVVTKACHEVLQHWKLSPFVIPYIMTMWIVWLCRQAASLPLRVEFRSLKVFTLLELSPPWALAMELVEATFLSIGRLFFVPHTVFGILLVAVVTAFSPRRGAFFLGGTAIATLTALALTGQATFWAAGLMSYNAGLVGLALASFPEKFSWRTVLFFAAVSAVLTVAARELLAKVGLPVLSLPYVLTLWLALLSRVPRVSVSWAPQTSGLWQPFAAALPATATQQRPSKVWPRPLAVLLAWAKMRPGKI